MGSFLPILALSALLGVGLWFFGSYRRAMKRAHRAILDSQKRVLDAAQTEHGETEVRLHSVEAEIDSLDLCGLAIAVDNSYPRPGTDPVLSPDDAGDEG